MDADLRRARAPALGVERGWEKVGGRLRRRLFEAQDLGEVRRRRHANQPAEDGLAIRSLQASQHALTMAGDDSQLSDGVVYIGGRAFL